MRRGKLQKRKIIGKKDSLANDPEMVYTLSRRLVDDKGKPCVSMGPLLRSKAFALSFAEPCVAEDESTLAKQGQSCPDAFSEKSVRGGREPGRRRPLFYERLKRRGRILRNRIAWPPNQKVEL